MATSKAVSDLEKLREKARSTRARFEPQWYLNLAFFAGKQWSKWAGGRIITPSKLQGAEQVIDNRILGIVGTEIAKMTKERPAFLATPSTADEEDVRAALMGERVLEYQWSSLDLARKRRKALLWSRCTGAGFLKVFWDSEAGDGVEVLLDQAGKPAINQQTGKPIKADEAQTIPPGGSVKSVHPGDVCVEVRTPFEIYPDPLCGEEGLESARWIIEESVRSPEYLKRRYDEDMEEDTDAVAGIAESRMPGIGLERSGDRGKGVKVSELWQRPTPDYPQGRWVVWAKDKVLRDEANPYPWLPYIMFSGVPVPGRFWPTSTTEQLISPQIELNKRRSQIAENASRIGNPPRLAPRDSNTQWEGLPGELVEFDQSMPGSVPAFLDVPELPTYVREDVDRIENALREISGQHEVTSGTVPSGVTAASAINLLQEQDDTRLGPSIEDMVISLGELGSRVLWLVGRYYKSVRTIRIAGEDGAWDIFDFRGAFLRGQTDVEVQAGASMPRSKAAKQATMEQMLNLLIQYGVQLDQRSLRRFFRDFEAGGLEHLFSDIDATETQIQRENRRLALGEAIPTNKYDDHEAHVTGHQDHQRSQRYEQYSRETKAKFQNHVSLHEESVQGEMESMSDEQLQELAGGNGAAPTDAGGMAGTGPSGAVPSEPLQP